MQFSQGKVPWFIITKQKNKLSSQDNLLSDQWWNNLKFFKRYSTSYDAVEALVLEAIKDQIQRRSAAPDAMGKGFLKLLSATCGFPEVSLSPRYYLTNIKLMIQRVMWNTELLTVHVPHFDQKDTTVSQKTGVEPCDQVRWSWQAGLGPTFNARKLLVY